MPPVANQSADTAPIVFVLDCDNTLLDNDAVKARMDARLRELLGEALTDEFWRVYEDIRARIGTVDLPATFAEFRPALSSDSRLEVARHAIMDFPFHDFLYSTTLDTLATLKQHGIPVIVSDGDTVYQPRKIVRSGLASAVDDQWVVYIHKEDHLDAIMNRWPAEFYVMIDDKGRILAETKARHPDRFVTVHVHQGHYAEAPANPAPDITLDSIGAVRDLDFAALRAYLRR
jgi:FMN phosphatase YigB (HAD superfamily)